MNKEFINVAIEESLAGKNEQYKKGGPFGAVIVKDNKIIARAHNTVVESNDPTAHSEVNVIREACKVLNTYDLKDCTMYSSCYPCPMCMSAIIWANIDKVYYGCTKEDAASIGFRDDMIYEYLKTGKGINLNLEQINREQALIAIDEYLKIKGIKY
jgi:guanine deaminase